MSSPSLPTLRQLRRLDQSSPDFQDKLCNILYGKDYVECAPNLRGDDVVWLVDYLNEVRRPVALPLPAQTCAGARWSRFLQHRCSEVSTRTQTYMWHKRVTPNIIHSTVWPSKYRSRSVRLWRFW